MQRSMVRGGLGAVVLMAAGLSGAWAETFPDRPVHLVVPWPAGGSTDLVARLVASGAESHLGQPIVAVNRPGAGGAVGTHALTEAEPDGYTIAIDGPGLVARQFALPDHPKLDDLQPVFWIGGDLLALAVRADTPWQTLDDFLDEARQRPVLLSGLQPGSAF